MLFLVYTSFAFGIGLLESKCISLSSALRVFKRTAFLSPTLCFNNSPQSRHSYYFLALDSTMNIQALLRLLFFDIKNMFQFFVLVHSGR